MLAEKALKDSTMALPPIVHSSGWTNGLIRGRESILNRLSGASQSTVINDRPSRNPLAPTIELATQLKSTLTKLKGAFMGESGTGVDYAALKDSEAYAAYRQEYLTALRDFDPQQLPSLAAARAFWINLYNALVLDAVITFSVKKSVTEGALGILTFFRRAAYLVGGQRVSLEDIEQGILRGNRGNPYVPGVHFASTDPRLAWSLPLDPRIHFALNCGGRSCPPILAYEAEQLETQLELAARGFIENEVALLSKQNELVLSTIFRWYAADFGGRDGILRLLLDYLPDGRRRQLLLTNGHDLRFAFSAYDWHLNTL